MSSQLIISGETGGTPPYQFYVCDEFMNNCFLLGQTGGTFSLNTFFSKVNTQFENILIEGLRIKGFEFENIV